MTPSHKKFLGSIERIPFFLSLFALLTIVFDFGFEQTQALQNTLYLIYRFALLGGVLSFFTRFVLQRNRPRFKVFLIESIILLFIVSLLSHQFGWLSIPVSYERPLLYLAVIIIIIKDFSAQNINFKQTKINPAQLFIASFLFIIISGTILLSLPKATHTSISFVDALFTATSAVCVTGLIVVDTGSFFTFFGQIVIILLIQMGGIGIMTFTSYFSYFFKGGSSYENQIMMSQMANSEKIAEVFRTLKIIILITFLIEGAGAFLIYQCLDPIIHSTFNDRVFFSVFHSVSGFCNAGFSTLRNSLFESGFRFNYPLHLSIAFLFIMGGLGFPIVLNFLKYLKHIFLNRIFRRKALYFPWVINLNTRIVLISTALLLFSGTLIFFILEYNNVLAEHSFGGKIVTAFFSASTPRTAGFNSVDFSSINLSTILIIILLMWVGASPGSTGGGIKTSTLAIGILNIISIARGTQRIEIFHREISYLSVQRAFAIILLSLATIGLAILLISWFENDKDIIAIAFECFSAYSTVGLSMGITGDLNVYSKIVIIVTMFVGRVSMLSILAAILRRTKNINYHYPTENILIN